jgi:hypothetical protein
LKPVDLSTDALGGPADDFVIVRWKAEVGDHWIAPLHVHHHDDEAWYVLSRQLGFRLATTRSLLMQDPPFWPRAASRTRIATPARPKPCTSC